MDALVHQVLQLVPMARPVAKPTVQLAPQILIKHLIPAPPAQMDIMPQELIVFAMEASQAVFVLLVRLGISIMEQPVFCARV